MHFDIRSLDNDKILSGLKSLAGRERQLQSEFIAYLGQVDQRRLYARKGYSSIFKFVVSELGYSESSALKRIQVSRLALKYSRVYFFLAEGRISLSAFSKIAPHVTPENAEEIFNEMSGKTVYEVERIIARHFPETDPSVTSLQRVVPLSEDRISIQFSASTTFEKKLRKARALLSHQFPKGKFEDIFAAALDALIAKIEPKRRHQAHSLTTHVTSRYIPHGIKSDVYQRDQGACTYVADNGKRCNETLFLEIDHVQPFALGGPTNTSNLRLLCRTHNRLRAEETFGVRDYSKVNAATTPPGSFASVCTPDIVPFHRSGRSHTRYAHSLLLPTAFPTNSEQSTARSSACSCFD